MTLYIYIHLYSAKVVNESEAKLHLYFI